MHSVQQHFNLVHVVIIMFNKKLGSNFRVADTKITVIKHWGNGCNVLFFKEYQPEYFLTKVRRNHLLRPLVTILSCSCLVFKASVATRQRTYSGSLIFHLLAIPCFLSIASSCLCKLQTRVFNLLENTALKGSGNFLF